MMSETQLMSVNTDLMKSVRIKSTSRINKIVKIKSLRQIYLMETETEEERVEHGGDGETEN